MDEISTGVEGASADSGKRGVNIPADALDRQEILRRALIELKEMRAQLTALEEARSEAIAIIGIGCRFPGGASSPGAFWQLLRNGGDAIVEVPPERWNVEEFFDHRPDAPGKMYTRWGGFLSEDISLFDTAFFRISPREAISLDPQQRLLLEVAWEAMEDAAIVPRKPEAGDTGVFIGISTNDYAQLSMFGDPAEIDVHTATGNALNAAAGRLAYFLNCHGPAVAVDTACSSSLVAVHLACQSLRNRECKLALAGGVNLILSPCGTIATSRARMMAQDGRCKTFDAAADGYVRGEGCAVIVLKRLSDAVADGDRILARVRGSAANQDGASSALTVPNGRAQEALIRQALVNARAHPTSLRYVELHGTGTPLGDPVEFDALHQVLALGRTKEQVCALGSVKTNIGHLEAAAGIAGLIKVVLALQHGELPPHLHLKTLNPQIPLEGSPFVVPTSPLPWRRGSERRLAGVSSFGFTGTNAHVIVEEAPEVETPARREDRPEQLLTISARSEAALKQLASRYGAHLETHPDQRLTDIAFTANTGRTHFAHRLAIVAESREQALERVRAFASGSLMPGLAQGRVGGGSRPKVVFLFSGQGAQFPGMGRQLYDTQPLFRQTLEQCAELLSADLGRPLLSVLYGDNQDTSLLDQTLYTQTALFAFEYALAQLWRSWGIEPSVVLGHSLGEYVAACLAGVFRLEDGLKLVARRAVLMQSLAADGQMASVFAPEEEVARLVEPYRGQVSIAAVNGPKQTVISGDRVRVQGILQELQQRGIGWQNLRVSHAFHSPLMESMLEEFRKVAETVQYAPPRVRLMSNVTGQAAEGDQIAGANYWVEHIRRPVVFRKAMETLQAQGYGIFVEIGPGATLLGMGQQCVPADWGVWLPSLRRGRGDWQQMLESLAELYIRGCEVDWSGFDRHQARRRVALPTYPFQRERFWAATPSRATQTPSTLARRLRHPLLGRLILSPSRQIQFQSEFRVSALPIVNAHRIYGMAWVNLVVYLEMALAGAAEVLGSARYRLEKVNIPRGLVLPEDHASLVDMVLTPGENGECLFDIFSFSADRKRDAESSEPWSGWALHAHGMLIPVPMNSSQAPTYREPVEEIRARCSSSVSRQEFYQTLRQYGVELGPECQWLESVWMGEGEAFGSIRSTQTEPANSLVGILPLGVIDACFQLLSALLPANAPRDYLLSDVERFDYFGVPGEAPRWCHAVLDQHDERDDAISGTLYLLTNSGQVVAVAAGARLQRVGAEALREQTERAQTSEHARRRPRPTLDLSDFQALDPPRQREAVRMYLLEELAATTGLAVSKLDSKIPLVEQLDSLMAVELKMRIESTLRIEVPVAAFFDGKDSDELSALIVQAIRGREVVSSLATQREDESIAEVLTRIENLSEEEARALLERERSDRGGELV